MQDNINLPAAELPRIVIVDDDTAVLSSLKFSLELEGYAVSTFHNGTELLRDGVLPATGCLVVDYHMQDGNGLDLLEHLRANHVTLPAILMTGHANAAMRRRAAAAGVPIVEKPFLGNTLHEGIRKALANNAPRTPER